MGISQALRAKAAQICGVIERWAGLNIGLMATNFTRPCNKSFRYLEELIIEPNAYYLTICYFRSVPFWIARPSNLGAANGTPEKTAISLEHDGENRVHRMLDPEWVEQLFASLDSVFLEWPI